MGPALARTVTSARQLLKALETLLVSDHASASSSACFSTMSSLDFPRGQSCDPPGLHLLEQSPSAANSSYLVFPFSSATFGWEGSARLCRNWGRITPSLNNHFKEPLVSAPNLNYPLRPRTLCCCKNSIGLPSAARQPQLPLPLPTESLWTKTESSSLVSHNYLANWDLSSVKIY